MKKGKRGLEILQVHCICFISFFRFKKSFSRNKCLKTRKNTSTPDFDEISLQMHSLSEICHSRVIAIFSKKFVQNDHSFGRSLITFSHTYNGLDIQTLSQTHAHTHTQTHHASFFPLSFVCSSAVSKTRNSAKFRTSDGIPILPFIRRTRWWKNLFLWRERNGRGHLAWSFSYRCCAQKLALPSLQEGWVATIFTVGLHTNVKRLGKTKTFYKYPFDKRVKIAKVRFISV